MSNTRENLASRGVLLAGPVVPNWFKLQSDGCSIPSRFMSKFLDALQTRAACYIHDYEYYLVNCCCAQDSVDRKHYRKSADVNLQFNRVRIGRGSTKVGKWWKGQVFGRWYYRGVRIGGKRALNKKVYTIPVPPSVKEIKRVEKDILLMLQKPMTEYGSRKLQGFSQLREEK